MIRTARQSQDVSVKRCDLCGNSRFERIGSLDRKGQPLATVICRTCGLVVHEQVPTEAELAAFYAQGYREQYHGESTPSDRRIMRAWRNGARIARRLGDVVTAEDEVFEVGAGIGCTVKQFERRGCQASGIEPHQGFQQFAARRLQAQVQRASLFDLPPQPRHDLVLLVHVIEHFRSPREALQHLHRIVRPGGLLYVECPNLAAPFAMRDKLFHFAHIHNFTAQTLEMLAARCGFVLERSYQDEQHPALEMLFHKAEPRELPGQDGYQQALAAVNRHTWASYHLRWSYLWPRVRKLAGYGVEHLAARHYVRRVLRQCQQAPPTQVRKAA